MSNGVILSGVGYEVTVGDQQVVFRNNEFSFTEMAFEKPVDTAGSRPTPGIWYLTSLTMDNRIPACHIAKAHEWCEEHYGESFEEPHLYPMNKYKIKVDNSYYTGESLKPVPISQPRHTGWTGHQPSERNPLVFSLNESDAAVIEGKRNMRSILERVLNELEAANARPYKTITIEVTK